jgi:hypothetical protein
VESANIEAAHLLPPQHPRVKGPPGLPVRLPTPFPGPCPPRAVPMPPLVLQFAFRRLSLVPVHSSPYRCLPWSCSSSFDAFPWSPPTLRHIDASRVGLVGEAAFGGFSHDADRACLREIVVRETRATISRKRFGLYRPHARRLSPSPAAPTPRRSVARAAAKAAAFWPRRGSGGTGSPSGVQGRSPEVGSSPFEGSAPAFSLTSRPAPGYTPLVRSSGCLSPSRRSSPEGFS